MAKAGAFARAVYFRLKRCSDRYSNFAKPSDSSVRVPALGELHEHQPFEDVGLLRKLSSRTGRLNAIIANSSPSQVSCQGRR